MVDFLVDCWIVDSPQEGTPLSRAILFDGILRSKDDEKLGQLLRCAGDGDLSLLHRFEQRGLRLGGSTVDFVGQDQVAENRPLLKHELTASSLTGVDLRASDVAGK